MLLSILGLPFPTSCISTGQVSFIRSQPSIWLPTILKQTNNSFSWRNSCPFRRRPKNIGFCHCPVFRSIACHNHLGCSFAYIAPPGRPLTSIPTSSGFSAPDNIYTLSGLILQELLIACLKLCKVFLNSLNYCCRTDVSSCDISHPRYRWASSPRFAVWLLASIHWISLNQTQKGCVAKKLFLGQTFLIKVALVMLLLQKI